ncbi:uncharacterized protein [Clytia hemisphaerica]|uniref:uncharacterized protein n=1 Tax=Clytia hemisphaerica TaxID=252671 RepID=UPI0034D70BCC
MSKETVIKKSTELGISVLIVIVNAVEICLIKRRRNKKNLETVLLSLSIADLLHGILNGAFQLVQIYEVSKSSWTSVFIIIDAKLFFMLVSIFHLLLIGADRLFAVARPFQHNTVVTKGKLYRTLFLVWVLSFIGLGLFKIYDEQLPKVHEKKPFGVISYQNVSWRIENTSQYNTTQTSKETARLVNETTLYSLVQPFDVHQDREKSGRKSTSPPPPLPPPGRKGRKGRKDGKPPPPPPQIMKRITTKENLLAYCLIVAAVSLVIMYSAIIYFVRNAQQEHIRRRVSLLSVLVPACFIAFTLHYAVMSLSSDDKTSFLPNVLLLTNSAANSFLYFFKDICKCREQKRKTTQKQVKVSNGESKKSTSDMKATSTEHIELQVTSHSTKKK